MSNKNGIKWTGIGMFVLACLLATDIILRLWPAAVTDRWLPIDAAHAQQPAADAGGPYVGVEGSPVALDGSGSTDADNDIVSYEWDLDNDGSFDDASINAWCK